MLSLSPRIWLAGGVVLAGLMGAGLVYWKGSSDAAKDAEIEQITRQLQESEQAVEILEADRRLIDKANANNTKSATEFAARLEAARLQKEELIDEIEDADRLCLGSDTVERLRSLWNQF